jgi:UDP-glucose:(heptosyl)LPS alpha-1,3-glucosyltransferase
MKIALIRERYTEFGGAERYVASLSEKLAAKGHEIHIFARSWNAAQTTNNKVSRLQGPIFHHRVAVLNGPSFLKILSFAFNTRKMLQADHYDVIQSFERTLYQDIYRAGDGCHREWLVQRGKIDPSYKGILNRVNPLHIVLLWLERQIFTEGNYTAIMANSKRGKREIMQLYQVPEEKIRVIYSPVDQKRFLISSNPREKAALLNRFGIEPGNPVLLFVGSGFKRKGLIATLKALALFSPPMHLIVVGKERLSPYQKLTKKLGIEKYVHFAGPIPDVAPYYLGSDLFVFPTIYEPFSNVCLEAMAAGLPLITSRINGASEVVLENENGYVIENPLDPIEIMKKIEKGLSLSKNHVQKINTPILNQLTWDIHVESVLDLYKSVIKLKGRSLGNPNYE